MDISKATITIPYSEFQKLQEQLEEIKWARDFKEKVDKGAYVEKEELLIYAKKLSVLGKYLAKNDGLPRSFAKENLSDFVKEYGFELEIQHEHGEPVIYLKEYKARKNG